MSGDRNLLFGAIAMQAGLLTAQQFAQGCSIWALHPTKSLTRILSEQGWLTDQDVAHIEYLVARNLGKAEGSVQGSFAGLSKDIQNVLVTLSQDTETLSNRATSDTQAMEPDLTFELAEHRQTPRYSLSSLHAAGGIGEVWLARDLDLQRDVAIKRLHSHRAPSARTKMRFLREARITGQLDHPGVVPIYELCLDEKNGQPFYAMRFLHGQTLTAAVVKYHAKRQVGGSEPQAFLRLLNAFIIVCNTVAYAHSKGIVHRDLKCDNVILGNYGEVMVIDWGLAKEVGGSELDHAIEAESPAQDLSNPLATQAGHILGSPAYMAPEQASGLANQIGPKTDVYGLCAILYEILCGRPPFVGTQTDEVLAQVKQVPPLPPSNFTPGIPDALERICMQGLAKAPADRPESAESLAQSIQAWISDLAEQRQAEAERERFFALSFDLLAIIDHEGRLRQVSPAWERLLGHNRAGLVGRQFDDFIHPEDVSASMKDLGASGSHGKGTPFSFESRARHANGSLRWFSWHATPIPQEKCVYVVGRDITALKKSEQLFEGILRSAPDAMVLINDQGHIVLVNQQAEKMFGYTPSELLGQPIDMLVPPQFRQGHSRLVAGFFQHASVRRMGSGRPLPAVRKNGQVFQVDIALSPIHTEDGFLYAAAVRDLSGRAEQVGSPGND